MTKEEKLEILKTENIKRVAEECIDDLMTVQGWFYSNEEPERACYLARYVSKAAGFIDALATAYGELNDNGFVNCDEKESDSVVTSLSGAEPDDEDDFEDEDEFKEEE